MQSVRVVAVGALTLATAFGALAITSAPAVAATTSTRYVAAGGDDSSGDSPNDCTAKALPCKTIQHAIDVASAGDTVSVAGGSYAEAVTVDKSLTLSGAGASTTTITGDQNPSIVTIGDDAGPGSAGDVHVTLSGFTVRGDDTQNLGVAVFGASATLDRVTVSGNNAGVISSASALTVTDSSITHNATYGVMVGLVPTSALKPASEDLAVPDGGSVSISGSELTANGIGVFDAGATKLTVSSSTISDSTYGGLYAIGSYLDGGSTDGSDAAIIVSRSTVRDNLGFGLALGPTSTTAVTDSTVSGTRVQDAQNNGPFSGEGLGAGLIVGGTLNVSNSTISGNASQGILAVSESGDGPAAYAAQVNVTDSTVVQTQATQAAPGGSDNPFPAANAAVASADYSAEGPQLRTAAAPASSGLPQPAGWLIGSGAVRRHAGVTSVHADATPTSNAQVALTASIVAGGGKDVPACVGSIADGGYNLATDDSCKLTAPGSLSETDPKLGTLADNGGPTRTQAPATGSAAIDVIPAGKSGCVSGATDQRGVSRPQGEQCDVGAVEVEVAPIVIHPASLPNGTVGTAYHATFTATGGADDSYVWSLAPGSSLPAGLQLSSAGVLTGTPSQAGTFHFTVSVNDPVLKSYTLTIAPAPAAPADNGNAPIANTGTHVTSMTAVGAGAVFAGFLVLMGAGLIGRRPGRHRTAR